MGTNEIKIIRKAFTHSQLWLKAERVTRNSTSTSASMFWLPFATRRERNPKKFQKLKEPPKTLHNIGTRLCQHKHQQIVFFVKYWKYLYDQCTCKARGGRIQRNQARGQWKNSMEITGAHPKTIILNLRVYNRAYRGKPQGKLLAPPIEPPTVFWHPSV